MKCFYSSNGNYSCSSCYAVENFVDVEPSVVNEPCKCNSVGYGEKYGDSCAVLDNKRKCVGGFKLCQSTECGGVTQGQTYWDTCAITHEKHGCIGSNKICTC